MIEANNITYVALFVEKMLPVLLKGNVSKIKLIVVASIKKFSKKDIPSWWENAFIYLEFAKRSQLIDTATVSQGINELYTQDRIENSIARKSFAMVNEPDQRLDLIFYRNFSPDKLGVLVKASILAFTEKRVLKKGTKHPISDHFGVFSELQLYRPMPATPRSDQPEDE